MRLNRTAVVFALLLGLNTGVALAADDAHVWLERMNTALATRNYDGTFFRLRGGVVESLRIIHRVQNGEVSERLVSLDGSGREFVRTGNELMCYLPDQRAVLVEQRPPDGLLLGRLPRFDGSTEAHYQLRQTESTRLMGRNTRVVEVSPRDDFRYGYRLWIDEATAMPLKTQLCDSQGNVIEQVVFSSLELPDHIPDSAFQPQISTAGFRWLRHSAPTLVSSANASLPGPPVMWDTLKLPAGFQITSRSSQIMPGSSAPVSHVVLSDGVASVSVFVEARGVSDADRRSFSTTETQLGSSAAFAAQSDGVRVTAVGEVPARTVRLIVGQVQLGARAAANLGAPAGSPGRSPPGTTDADTRSADASAPSGAPALQSSLPAALRTTTMPSLAPRDTGSRDTGPRNAPPRDTAPRGH